MSRQTGPDAASDPETRQLEAESGVVPIVKEVVGEITDDDVPGLAAEVAYHAIFSIPAMLVVFATLAALINNVADYDLETRLNKIINDSAPESTQPMLEELVTKAVAQVDGGAATIGLASAVVVALWAGSNGVAALIKAFNRAYDTVEERSFVKKKLAAVLLTIVMGLVVNLALALWIFGGQIGSWLAGEFSMGSTFDWVWNLSRMPVGAAVIVLMLGLLYYFGPVARQEMRWVLPGAVFSTVAWGLLVFGFSIYMRFASPGSAYGALSGVIVFLFFLYLTALIFLVGAELNAVLGRRHDFRYRAAIRSGVVEIRSDARTPAAPQQAREAPISAGSLAIGAAATVGIILVSLLGRRNS